MWKDPPVTKIYEALGTVADGRLEMDGNYAKCFSSSGNKYYDITYDEKTNAIMANDNSSYWQGYVGYPAIAFLLKKGVLEYREDMAELLKNVAWKDTNQKFKNDFEKALEFILKDVEREKRAELDSYVYELLMEIKILRLSKLGKRIVPPKGY
jgi:hypothetical protein